MYLLAAEGADTWGISGPAFLRIYVIAAAGFLTGTLLIRRWIRGGRRSERELHPYEVAYLIGGPRRAIATAVAGLRADDAIEASEDGQLCVTAAPRVMRTPLDTAIHNTVQAGKVTSAQTLRVGYEVRQAVDQLRDVLVRDGLAVGPRQRARSRLAVVFLVVLLGVGVARLVAGAWNGHPVGYLLLMLMALAVVIVVLLVRVPRALRSGTAAVEAVRSRQSHLDPSMSPAWTTYGATGAAFGVALFGVAALNSIDPEFAASSDLPTQFLPVAGVGGLTGWSDSGIVSTYGSSGGGSCGGAGGCGGGGGCGG
jgi:uncharacterized protein (TIGR04222 family)